MHYDLQHIETPVPDWLATVLAVPRAQSTVTVEGCPINYFTWGNPAHPPLLFAHGRMSHARFWTFTAPVFADQYFCIAVDSSGMGDSGHRDFYAYDTRADEFLAVLHQTGAATRRPTLVTHSYGCVIALNAIERADFEFSGLIACDPSFTHPDLWAKQTPRVDGPELKRPNRAFPTIKDIKSRWRFAPEQTCQHEVLKEYIAVHAAAEDDEGWRWKFDPWVYSSKDEGHNDWWVRHTQNFLATQIPKSIIYGEESAMLDAATVDAVAALSETIVHTQGIPNAHHHLMVDEPHLVVTAIRQALTAIAA